MQHDHLLSLSHHHPVVIEGMGGFDTRDPAPVASRIVQRLNAHWEQKPITQPPLIVIQGDPLEARGISAITPLVAAELGASRGLVCLDESIADYHAPNADRNNVIVEVRYSQLAAILNHNRSGTLQRLEAQVDRYIGEKNLQRRAKGKPPLKDYFRDFALLQEVTKAACHQLSGGITVAHTSSEIHPFSVTSFYTVGIELGLMGTDDIVTYRDDIPVDKSRYQEQS
ncbi:hypothetical protein ACU6TU_02680 [Halomonas sp. LS-001]